MITPTGNSTSSLSLIDMSATCALFFGLVHWGISVGVLAALPTSLLIGLGAVIWGKAAYETRGLAWPIVAHFMIDVAIMGAYFV